MNIKIEKNLKVPMRDGVELLTDVYRPATDGPVPAIVQRLPYDKEHVVWRNQSIDVLRVVQQGYAVVTQDSRGTYSSSGKFDLFADEGRDGADTIEWAAAQPWSTDKVGTVGASYYGAAQWLAAGQAPGHLAAIAPFLSSPDYYGGWAYRGGAFELGFQLLWGFVLGSGELLRRIGEGRATVEQLLAHLGGVDSIGELYRHLPLDDLGALGDLAPHYFEWLAHPNYDHHWQKVLPATDFQAIQVPGLSIGGWYDIFLRGTLAGYRSLKATSGSAAARRPRLVIGPWAHGPQVFGAFPERDFGVLASAEAADVTAMHLRWFDRHLKGIEDGYDSEPPVKIFVIGPNVWRDEEDWPLPDTSFTDYFLHSGGNANSSRGDGGLDLAAPADEAEDAFLYDPRNPVPTRGGQAFLPGLMVGVNSGPRDQAALEQRHDVLCYTSSPLERDLEVTGPVELILFCSSSALDTDFTGKLVDVHPDGRAEIVTDGILRMRYRESSSDPTPLEPNQVYEVRIDLSATATVFAAGHRLRLEVSSSNFPRFDRNTNTGGTIASDGPADLQVAVNRVFHDRPHPSRLVLPVIDRR